MYLTDFIGVSRTPKILVGFFPSLANAPIVPGCSGTRIGMYLRWPLFEPGLTLTAGDIGERQVEGFGTDFAPLPSEKEWDAQWYCFTICDVKTVVMNKPRAPGVFPERLLSRVRILKLHQVRYAVLFLETSFPPKLEVPVV